MKATPETNHLVGLDGCRAIACIGVFIVNYLNKTSFEPSGNYFDIAVISGRFGIVTLIVLSGFGLSLPFWRSLILNEEWPSTLKFLFRRFLRIIPLYYICLIALIVHNEIWLEAGGWTDILLHFSFLYNYSNESFYSINPVFWVLAYFIHFYIVLPILFLVGKNGTKSACIVFLAAIIISYAVHYYLYTAAEASGSVVLNLIQTKSFLAYLPIFLVGSLCGGLYIQYERKGTTNKSDLFWGSSFWIIMTALVVLLGTPLAEYGQLPYAVYYFPLVPVLISLLILSAASGGAASLLASPPVRMLALLSYGIFIFHYPVINLCLRLLPKMSIDPMEYIYLTGIFAFTVTFVIASIANILVEKPIKALSKKLFV